jgi:hypothetical protein
LLAVIGGIYKFNRLATAVWEAGEAICVPTTAASCQPRYKATVPGQHTLAHACALASCCHPHSPVVLPLAGPAVRAAVVGVGVVNALVAAAVATGTHSQQDSTLPMRATALHCSRSPRLPSLPQESCDKTHWNSQQQEVSLAGMHRRFYTAIEHGARWTR